MMNQTVTLNVKSVEIKRQSMEETKQRRIKMYCKHCNQPAEFITLADFPEKSICTNHGCYHKEKVNYEELETNGFI